MQTTLGGDRLGSGNKQKVELHEYSRSTHDLSYVWRSTMSAGTLVPFMSEVGLPGDTFDIDLECDIKTHPTIGPLFGSYKVQLDIFQCPIRLYNGKLHMNMLNIGMNMNQIKLPQLQLSATPTDKVSDNSQINPSCILKYLGISGVGRAKDGASQELLQRFYNAIPYLSYADIYKNYYANKQEEYGAVIHNDQNLIVQTIDNMKFFEYGGQKTIEDNTTNPTPITLIFDPTCSIVVDFDTSEIINYNTIQLTLRSVNYNEGNNFAWNGPITELFKTVNNNDPQQVIFTEASDFILGVQDTYGTLETDGYIFLGGNIQPNQLSPKITLFPLENIDKMRENILVDTLSTTPFLINQFSLSPYGLICKQGDSNLWSKQSSQEGLFLKTYQSDLNNNWISTEWIDGENGINVITSVNTEEGFFTIDSLQLSKKVYDMLNRIAVSGGTYDDWLDAVYTHQRTRSIENPIYQGGLSKELVFQEVISNAQAETTQGKQPLGTLAGRGALSKKHKGGKIKVSVNEPSYIMGIISITPRIDYSQSTKWDVNLKTMDDLHKPALDQIGFQSLLGETLAWWDSTVNEDSLVQNNAIGKQPAWINYMTNVNRCYGNFAVAEGDSVQEGGQMFMTLNRRYEQATDGTIKDATTYIDPKKFNNIFADTRLDAQNFWTQIGVNITARRKMSAKLMPNL